MENTVTQKIHVVVPAAGKGVRMGAGNIPKALVPFNGRPIVCHLLDSIDASGVCHDPIIVVGHKGEMVKELLGSRYRYAFQEEQLGTGHAVRMTKPLLEDDAQHVLVLYSDHPLVTASTIQRLVKTHLQSNTVLTMMTTVVDEFTGWKQGFLYWGRILRDRYQRIIAVVEEKDATDAVRSIRELNPSFFCFRADWLWSHLQHLTNKNAQKEYYLTDLVKMAMREGEPITSIQVDPMECLGVNTKEELIMIEGLSKKGKKI